MASVDESAVATPVDWVLVRRLAVGGYLLILVVWFILFGVPLDRVPMTGWIVAGLGCLSIGRGWRAYGRVLLDWLPFEGILLAYDYTRGFAGQFDSGGLTPPDGAHNVIGASLHTKLPIRVDEWLFGGTLPTQWLQDHLYNGGRPGWYTVLFSLCYFSHFLATPIIAVVLWIRWRERFRAWIYCVLALSVVGLSIYFLFPTTPPWLASQQGYISGAPVGRYTSQGWELLHLQPFANAIVVGQAKANLVAAMPSLHVGFATLVAGFFFFGARWWVKCLLACYPLLMSITLVYAGEHYVLDEIAGALCAIAVLAMWRLLRLLRMRRQQVSHGRSAGEVSDRQDLLSATDGSADITQGGRGEADPVGAERHRDVEADPRGVRGAHQVDAEIDVGIHQLGGSGAGGTAIGGVNQHHE